MTTLVLIGVGLAVLASSFLLNKFRQSPHEITLDLGHGVNLELLLIPEGSFVMGDESGFDNEKPVHRVTITKPFYMGKYKVTQEQWEAIMGGNPSKFRNPRNPVERVSWNECQTFVDKLNAKVAGQGRKFALPTEAQWEYACRAGVETSYSFGSDEARLGDYAWYDANSEEKAHPVGEKKPNAWGLYDMHGNLFEWCQDWYDPEYYAKSPPEDPRGAATGSDRVGRGSGWNMDARNCRSARRACVPPGGRNSFLGLRVCLVPVR